MYNSLRFKLFNTTGSMVYYEGNRTQWEYVPVGGELQKGDILFFSELPKRSKGVIKGSEFVTAGKHSGNVTDCAVYLGDDSILCLKEGKVAQLDDGMSRNFWGHIKGAKYRFPLQDGTWDFS